jgi:phosphate uptake regulator
MDTYFLWELCMELRRVQRTSGGTFFVCLPKDWAERSRLDRSSLVSLSETADGRLIVDAKYSEERAPKIVVIKPNTPLIEREITGKYLLGYDIIRVEAKDRMSTKDRELIKQVSSRLIGLEIIEEDYSKIVLQCLLEPSAFPPDKILQREQSIVSSMHRDAVTALIEGDVHLATNVSARDNEVNRLYFLLVRVLRTIIQNSGLSEKLGISALDCLDYRLAASLVEAIGDQSVQIAELTVKLGNAKISKELAQLLLRLHRTAFEAHENAFKALFARDIALAETVRSGRQTVIDLYAEVESALRKERVDFAPQILAAASAISSIYDHSQDIADLIMPKTS